jgi:hypothetical protein
VTSDLSPLRGAASVLLWGALGCSGAKGCAPPGATSPAFQDGSHMSTVETIADLKAMQGQRVTLRGTAADAKMGAVILVEEEPVYLTDLDFWPAALRGKRVRATGLLKLRKNAPDPLPEDGGAIQGAWGDAWLLDEPQWVIDSP